MNAPKTQTAWHDALDSATEGHEIEWRDVALEMLSHARELENRLTRLIEAYDRTANCMSPEGYQEMQHELLEEMQWTKRALSLPNTQLRNAGDGEASQTL